MINEHDAVEAARRVLSVCVPGLPRRPDRVFVQTYSGCRVVVWQGVYQVWVAATTGEVRRIETATTPKTIPTHRNRDWLPRTDWETVDWQNRVSQAFRVPRNALLKNFEASESVVSIRYLPHREFPLPFLNAQPGLTLRIECTRDKWMVDAANDWNYLIQPMTGRAMDPWDTLARAKVMLIKANRREGDTLKHEELKLSTPIHVEWGYSRENGRFIKDGELDPDYYMRLKSEVLNGPGIYRRDETIPLYPAWGVTIGGEYFAFRMDDGRLISFVTSDAT